MRYFLDFEWRSKVNVKDVGTAKVAEDESTLPLMLAVGSGGNNQQWVYDLSRHPYTPDCPQWLLDIVTNPENELHAHNATAEIDIWNGVCFARWGWPEIPINRWWCTAAKASAANQPRGLDNLSKRLGVSKKDKRGKELVELLTSPQKALKTRGLKSKGRMGVLADGQECSTRSALWLKEQGQELFEGKDPKSLYYWNVDEELHKAFAEYNLQDVIAEEAVDNALPDLPESERRLWVIDREMNARGLPIDLDLCQGALAVYEIEVDKCNAEIREICHDEKTKGTKLEVQQCTQDKRILHWMRSRSRYPEFSKTVALDVKGNPAESLKAECVDFWLREYENQLGVDWWEGDPRELEKVKRVLELRQIVGGAAVKKYKAAIQYAQRDGRARNQAIFYGAATGRWTGKGIQPHNFKRAATPDETFVGAVSTGDYNSVELFASLLENEEGEAKPTDVVGLLKACVRGIIKAPEGKTLIVSDFAGIEGRVSAWLCNHKKKLDLYRDGQDTYIHAALDIFSCKEEDIADWNGKKWKIKPEHKEKRQVGKVAELALTYGMGAGTYQANVEKEGIKISLDFAQEVVDRWRAANDDIRQMWYRLEKACKHVIQNKTQSAKVNSLRIFWHDGGYLCIQLPSDRILYYYGARIDKETGQIEYLDGSKGVEKAAYVSTYGGKLFENVTQASARDVLRNSMFICHEERLAMLLTVHDEIILEADKQDAERQKAILHKAMQTVPEWCPGLPLAAETYVSERYTK